MKVVTIGAVGMAMAGLFTFWAMNTASADTSSSFQNANVAFQKAVKASDVVVGHGANTVGLLHDEDGKCVVQVWQSGTRDAKTTLQVDQTTVDGVCKSTTPLPAAESTDNTQELVYDIKAPAFSYQNLGGRDITFGDDGASTLATGSKPSTVKATDWADARPYKVTLDLEALDSDNVKVTQKAVVTGFTNVQNVTAASDDLRYVPAPSDDPIPGPVTITGISRSQTAGAVYSGAHEGVAVTFNGAVCSSGPTKVEVGYTQQGPSAADPVSTVLNGVLSGGATTVDLGQVANGSSGSVKVAATCTDGGIPAIATQGYTQTIPSPTLTVKQNSDLSKHDLSWTQVSSLPTTFNLYRYFDGDMPATDAFATTDQLNYQSVYDAGTNLGLTTHYSVVAVVDGNKSDPGTADITTPLPAPAKTTVTSDDQGADWTGVSCPAYSTAQYSEQHYQQTGTSTAVNWSKASPWSTDLSSTGITTPAYGRTVTQVSARCAAVKSTAVSPASVSNTDAYYMPETLQTGLARSATTGALYAGAREGITVLSTGARCYGGTKTTMTATWVPQVPAGQSNVVSSTTLNPSGGADAVNIAGAANGTTGFVDDRGVCSGVKSGTTFTATGYTQALPTPTTSAAQGSSVNQQVTSWGDISSLPVSYVAQQNASANVVDVDDRSTSALSSTYDYPAGSTYGNKIDYSVYGKVGNVTSSAAPIASITAAWPAVPDAKSIGYTRTGAGGDYYGGRITWAYTGSCPAGTTNEGRVVENRTGQSNGTISTTVRATSGYTDNANGYTWDPSYGLEGYAFGVRIDNICNSDVTNLSSPLNSTQGANFVTPMQTPAAPVWNGYNISDRTRNTNWTPNTALTSTTVTLKTDYITYCSAGSNVNYSNFTSTSWAGNDFNHPLGYWDYWQLPNGSNAANVVYHDANYTCDTPWKETAHSPDGANKTVQVRR
jgi:hypothetical protein